jgi:uncharacterized membrane protein YbhN (UPF0104 family)
VFDSARAKSWARRAGWLLTIVSLGYIVWRFTATDALRSLVRSGRGGSLLSHVLLGGAVYLVGLHLLALAWWQLQSAFTRENPSVPEVCSVYAISQFAKYLPGNVAHYLTRHALLRRLALPHGSLLASAALEAGGLLIGALCWALPAEHGLFGRVLGVSAGTLLALLGVGLVLFVAAIAWAATQSKRFQTFIPAVRGGRLLPALALYPVFFAFMGAAVSVSASGLLHGGLSWSRFVGILAASWAAGFVVIGSPAGIGIREAVLLALLKGVAPESDVLLLAAAFRGTTMLGDLLFFLSGGLLRRHVLGTRLSSADAG